MDNDHMMVACQRKHPKTNQPKCDQWEKRRETLCKALVEFHC